MPNVASVFPHRAVAGKFAHAGHIENRFSGPGWGVVELESDLLLDFKVRWHIGQMEIFIPVIHDRLIDPREQARLEGAEQIRIRASMMRLMAGQRW